MTGLVPVPFSRAFYSGIKGIEEKEGQYYLSAGIAVSGKYMDSYHMALTPEQVSSCEKEGLSEMEKILFKHLIERYPLRLKDLEEGMKTFKGKSVIIATPNIVRIGKG